MLRDNGSFTLNGAAAGAAPGGPKRVPGRRPQAVLWTETKTRILPAVGGPARQVADRYRNALLPNAIEGIWHVELGKPDRP